MDRYDDYKRGMRLLKEETVRLGLYGYISSYKWISRISWVLTKFGACEKFWYNTCIQGRARNIIECKTVYDLFWGDNVYLFQWDKTDEDYDFWSNIARDICNRYGYDSYMSVLSDVSESDNTALNRII